MFTAAKSLDRRLSGRLRSSSASAAVASFWDGLASDEFVHQLGELSWGGIPEIHRNHDFLITGRRDTYWVDWIRQRYFQDGQAGDVLSLGCGSGHLDRIFAAHGFVMRSLTGLDISPAAIALAQNLAETARVAPTISYRTADLNTHVLPAERFDFIYFFQSLHHIERLEHVLDQCHRALRPTGVLLVNEFVGPSRFQWTDEQIELANAQLTKIPPALRRDRVSGQVKTEVHRPSVAEMIATDPSEAVRSAEIERLLRSSFDVRGAWDWGGTVNHLVLQNIAGNFEAGNSEHDTLIRQLVADENRAIQDGAVPSDFKVFVASRKSDAVAAPSRAVT